MDGGIEPGGAYGVDGGRDLRPGDLGQQQTAGSQPLRCPGDHRVEDLEAVGAAVEGGPGLVEAGLGGEAGQVVGYALYFHTYSTFLGRPSLYLEDLFVLPENRGQGHGKALLAQLARVAVERDCGRFEWMVLDWNTPAILFYESLGAVVSPEWMLCRMTGDALRRFAATVP